MSTRKMAQHHSATAFLNSLFLEWNKVEKVSDLFIVSLKDEKIYIPIKKFSLLGRHQYEGSYFTKNSDGSEIAIDFKTLVQKISEELGNDSKDFVERVLNSSRNIELSLNKRAEDINHLYETETSFQTAEQALLVGHTFHPAPKSKSEFSDDDYEAYSPEMGSHFKLQWLFVAPEVFFQKTSERFADPHWLKKLFIKEFGTKRLNRDFIPFPIHPWQKQFIYQHPDVIQYLSEGKILEVEPSETEWFPTSSLRTVYTRHSDYQLKFSMNLKLTNSVRHLLEKELDRGLQLHDVLTTDLGQKFVNENPVFEVIHEPVYAALRDKSGNPIQITLMMGRENIFKIDSESIVVATLTQEHPYFEKSMVENSINALINDLKTESKSAAMLWFETFLQVGLKPLLNAQKDYGILLGSHQQNMILEIHENLPFKSYFRDCNGTGYSKLGHTLFAHQVPSLVKENGNILEGDEANYLLGYYVIINTTFNLISSIAQTAYVSEEELIKALRTFLLDLRQENPKDPSFLDYLLSEETLKHKGNFFCSLNKINENTESNPLSIYTEIPNPLYVRTH